MPRREWPRRCSLEQVPALLVRLGNGASQFVRGEVRIAGTKPVFQPTDSIFYPLHLRWRAAVFRLLRHLDVLDLKLLGHRSHPPDLQQVTADGSEQSLLDSIAPNALVIAASFAVDEACAVIENGVPHNIAAATDAALQQTG